jgi:hypothetical protein
MFSWVPSRTTAPTSFLCGLPRTGLRRSPRCHPRNPALDVGAICLVLCTKRTLQSRLFIVSLIESMREPILASGHLTAAELRAHIAALSEHLSDPATTLIDKLLVQAWGQKPR